jgi:hypothetical protein
MNHAYAPKTFLRQCPNSALKKYFDTKGVSIELDWKTVTPRKVEPLFDAIEELPDDERKCVERDFRLVFEMATEKGRLLFVEQAEILGVDLGERFADGENAYEAAMIAILEYTRIFEIASCVHDIFRIGNWRKRTVGERLHATDDPERIQAFEAELKRIYKKQGRGRSCHIDRYQRLDPLRICYFAYPEDFPTSDIEFDEQHKFRRVTRRPALENVFVYSPEAGTLDISATGPKEHKESLAEAFCIHILELKALPPEKARPEYTLKPVMDPAFRFPIEPGDGVERIDIKSLRLDYPDAEQTRVTVDTKPNGSANAIHESMKRTLDLTKFPLERLHPSRAEVTVEFKPVNGQRAKRLMFPITYPDRCGLGDDPLDQVARQILRRAGIAND